MTVKATKKRKRGGGPRALGHSLAKVTRAIFGKRGFADGAILKDWPTIAGEHLARHSLPERVIFPRGSRAGGTLHLRIDNGSMATELQHLEPLLIERINGYFGFGAIKNLKITQGPLPETGGKPARARRRLDGDDQEDLARSLISVDDAELRQALEALGRAVMERRVD